MYTQCPDCSTAFRVTAEVLKQAAGKVRCGGCGNAFNALEYLSEKTPGPKGTPEPAHSLPELTPDPPEKESDLPQSISADQSAALLKTLDELAGSDIRIEDTGVEWRVFDDDEDESDETVDVGDARESIIDEPLDASPTPVDQFLTATPHAVEAPEVFEESANEPGRTPVDELRFDDNTPLPEDFDLDDEPFVEPETPTAEPFHPSIDDDEPQPDLSLSEPDEWEDILDEFDDLADPAPAPLEAELAALDDTPDEQTDDHDEQLEDETPGETAGEKELLDMDTQFALQAEAMGIDLSGMHNELEESVEIEAQSEEADAALDKASAADADDMPDVESDEEPDEEIEEAPDEETAEGPDEEIAEEPDEEVAEEPDEEVAEDPDVPSEEDLAQPDLVEDTQENGEAPLEFGNFEQELADLEALSDVFAENFFEAADEGAGKSEDKSPGSGEEIELGEEVDLDAQPDLKEELTLAAEPYPENELELADSSEQAAVEAEPGGEEHSADEHVVPPMSEEEQTINMMIDQDLLNLAVEDDDGFASTIIIPENDAEKKRKKKDRKGKKKDKPRKKSKPAEEEQVPGFETIIMEGENIRFAFDEEKLEADAAAAAELVAKVKAEDVAIAAASKNKRVRLVGGIVVLVLLLIVQVLHQSREALATKSLFNDVVGPVYRAFGKPLAPAWDVTGWRFEASEDIINEDEDELTVISRIGNKSETALPYPVIGISLTDRYEETIGSRVLDPAEYLPDHLDPNRLVQPGSNFTAVMTIVSPSEEATGYKLKACYRVSGGQLRCHIPDFK